jgi:hypothetical protein
MRSPARRRRGARAQRWREAGDVRSGLSPPEGARKNGVPPVYRTSVKVAVRRGRRPVERDGAGPGWTDSGRLHGAPVSELTAASPQAVPYCAGDCGMVPQGHPREEHHYRDLRSLWPAGPAWDLHVGRAGKNGGRVLGPGRTLPVAHRLAGGRGRAGRVAAPASGRGSGRRAGAVGTAPAAQHPPPHGLVADRAAWPARSGPGGRPGCGAADRAPAPPA